MSMMRGRGMANDQQGSIKRFTYNGPNSQSNHNPLASEDWFSGLPIKSKSEQSIPKVGTDLDDVWSIRKNVSATLNHPAKQTATPGTHPSKTGYYSRHGQYSKGTKLDGDMSGLVTADQSGLERSGGYSYGQSRTSYSYAGAAGLCPGQNTSPRLATGPKATRDLGKGGIGPPLIGGSHSPTRSSSQSSVSHYSRGKGNDGWSSF